MIKQNNTLLNILMYICMISTTIKIHSEEQQNPLGQSFYTSSYVTEKHDTLIHPEKPTIDESTITPLDRSTKEEPAIEQPLVDLSEAKDADFSFFNDPYLFEQYEQQPLHDLTQLEVPSGTTDTEKPVVDLSETSDVDFSYFNDPYAFEKFRTGLPIKAKFGGYVQHSSWWDSRQALEAGDGYVFIIPKPREFDVDCQDINARGEFNMSMIETRVRAELFGPKILGAESYAYIESDIFGSGVVINRFRVRHAFIQLTWPEESKVMLGQFWHPMFLVKTFPLVVSFDGGIPIAPFSRNPQIRYTYYGGNKELLIAAIAQLQFTSNGPIGFSSTYLRNSRMPMLMIRGAYDSERVYGGGGLVFQRLKPRLESNKGFRVNESINSVQATAFATIKLEPVEIRQQLIYAQNANDLSMLSGFAVTSVNPTTDERRYTNTNAVSYWMDININRQIEPGLFIGITKNLGAHRNIIQCLIDPATGQEERTLYGLAEIGDQVDTLFRISPRVRFHVLPIDFAAEIEYTRSASGCINNRARIDNIDPVSNTRLIFTAYYYF
ncbi:MAG: hypothetical protein WD055_01845 [Candidatus Dependentiae bacterium]